MRFAVVGPGAIGGLMGGLLVSAGFDTTFVGREGTRARQIQERGLRIRGACGELDLKPKFTTSVDSLEPMDLVLTTVKAYDTEGAIRMHESLFRRARQIVSLQNGIGNVEKIELIAPRRVLAASTTYAAYIDGEGIIHASSRGELLVGEMTGEVSQRAQDVAGLLGMARILSRPVADMHSVLFLKLGVNCAINPITAFLQVPNGEISLRRDLHPLISAIAEEVSQVAAAEGIRMDATMLALRTCQVAEMTRKNHSSMMKDVALGRRTEIESINGAIVRLGLRHSIPTPVNQALYELIHSLPHPSNPA